MIPPQILIAAALIAWTSAHGAETHASGASQNNPAAAVASFDCAHITSVNEKAICADPALAALDGQLGRLYREKRTLLSPQGGKLLQNSQRSWLRFIGTVCSSDGPKDKFWLSRSFCLTRQYTDRLNELRKIAQIGPFVFNRVDLYGAQLAQDESGQATGFFVQHVGYPQIDNVNSPQLRAWNEGSSRSLPTDGDCGPGDYDVDYDVGYANPRFVSVEWINSTYFHGTPHGFYDVKSKNTVLAPQMRALTAQDVFGSGESWTAPLKEQFWTALTRAGWSPPGNQPNVKQELEIDFIQPDRWLFTKDGLQVAFDAYEGGCYACTPKPVTVPWSELRPLLSKTAIAP
jgi:uncharacterized protein